MSKGVEEQRLAEHHEAKADGLERQLDHTVFSDDDDAIPALEARIALHEGQRDHMKRVNALYRKGDAVGLKGQFGLDLAELQQRVAKIGIDDPV